MKFSYLNSTMIHFGQGQISTISTSIPTCSKVLVIYGGGSIKHNGVYQQVSEALSNHAWVEFSGVEPNPTKETLDNAIAKAKTEQVDFILAVGGGSVIDGAKFVAAGATYDGDSWDIMTGKHAVIDAVPLGAILTLPATGSESNKGAVITKAQTQDKLPFFSPAVQPVFAVLDPDTMKTLPERQLVNGIVDAWVHVCEQYITLKTDAMVQDGYAETLLRTLLTLGQQYVNKAQLSEAQMDAWRGNLMFAANQALNGLIGSGVTSDWATHMIGHELTALWNVDHGRSLAIIQPSLLRNQLMVKKAKLEQMGKNVFNLPQSDDLALKTIDAIEAFYHSLDVETQLTGCPEGKLLAVDKVLEQLKKHGMVALGEHQVIDLTVSKAILEQAIA